MYRLWTVLLIGWCPSPYMYHSVSDEVAQYLRSRNIPTSAWLDNIWLSNVRVTRDLSLNGQHKAAREAVALALTGFYRCGYFMPFSTFSLEPITDLVSLGAGYDTAQRRFYMPEDQLLKVRKTINRRSISSNQLDKLAGKCTSMSVVVPPASLYTHHVYP